MFREFLRKIHALGVPSRREAFPPIAWLPRELTFSVGGEFASRSPGVALVVRLNPENLPNWSVFLFSYNRSPGN